MLGNKIFTILATLLFISLLMNVTQALLLHHANEKAAACTANINLQNQSIMEAHLKYLDLSKQLKSAEQSAVDMRKKSSEEINKILNDKVPSECEAAVQWGVNQLS